MSEQDKCACGAPKIAPVYRHRKYDNHSCVFHTSLHCKVCTMISDLESYLEKWARFDQYLKGQVE